MKGREILYDNMEGEESLKGLKRGFKGLKRFKLSKNKDEREKRGGKGLRD